MLFVQVFYRGSEIRHLLEQLCEKAGVNEGRSLALLLLVAEIDIGDTVDVVLFFLGLKVIYYPGPWNASVSQCH